MDADDEALGKEMRMKDLTEITPKVRERVLRRDSYDDHPCCQYCGSPYNIEVHHLVERSRGGMGIEQNLICLCTRCHQRLHSGEREIKVFCEDYLHNLYPDYTERDLIYRKEDYESHSNKSR